MWTGYALFYVLGVITGIFIGFILGGLYAEERQKLKRARVGEDS